MERIDQIKKRLEGVRGRKWKLENDELIRVSQSGSIDTLLCYPIIPKQGMKATFRSEGDAVFIAEAPEDVRWLLAHIGELEFTVETLRELRDEESRGR